MKFLAIEQQYQKHAQHRHKRTSMRKRLHALEERKSKGTLPPSLEQHLQELKKLEKDGDLKE